MKAVVLKPALPGNPAASPQAVTNYAAVNNVPSSPLIGRLIHEPSDVVRKAQPMAPRDWLAQAIDDLLLVAWAGRCDSPGLPVAFAIRPLPLANTSPERSARHDNRAVVLFATDHYRGITIDFISRRCRPLAGQSVTALGISVRVFRSGAKECSTPRNRASRTVRRLVDFPAAVVAGGVSD